MGRKQKEKRKREGREVPGTDMEEKGNLYAVVQ